MKRPSTLLAIVMLFGCGKSAEDIFAIQKLKDEIASLEKHAGESEMTAERLRQGVGNYDFEAYKVGHEFMRRESPYASVEPTQEDYLKVKQHRALLAGAQADEYESWAADSREKAAAKKELLSRIE